MKLFAKLLLVACLVTVLPSCAAMPLHPGAVNRLDSTTYDVLLGAKTLIDTSRDEFAKGTLDAKLKPLVNDIVAAYDKASPIYRDWHNLEVKSAGSGSSKLTELNDAILTLNKTIAAFKGAK